MVSAESADVTAEGDVQVDHQTTLSQGTAGDRFIQRFPKAAAVLPGDVYRSKRGVKKHDIGEHELKGVHHFFDSLKDISSSESEEEPHELQGTISFSVKRCQVAKMDAEWTATKPLHRRLSLTVLLARGEGRMCRLKIARGQ